MPDPDRKSESSPDKKGLEDWLQLPENYEHSDEDTEEVKVDDTPIRSLEDLDVSPVPVDLITGELLEEPESPIIEEPEKEPEVTPGSLDPEEPFDEETGNIEPSFSEDDRSMEQEAEPAIIDEHEPDDAPEDPVELALFPEEIEVEISEDQIEPQEIEIKEIQAEEEIDDLRRLENIMAKEFGDTLTGANAVTFPLGILLIILSAIIWFIEPISGLFGLTGLVNLQPWISGTFSVILAIAGLHLIFYWLVHWISNSVKLKELDRLIENRRIHHPCRHLNCRDVDENEVEEDGDEIVETDMIWRCELYETDLSESTLCVICDNYSPEDPMDSDRNSENQNSSFN